MSRVAFAAALVALVGCTWSNSLYQARVSSSDALKAEREQRTLDAENAWALVVVKAESAYARRPGGSAGAEALWLKGRALSRRRDCAGANRALEASAMALPQAPWRDDLLRTLGDCREQLNDPGTAATFRQLAQSRDAAMRRYALLHVGTALARQGAWEEALQSLAGLDVPSARANRAAALISLDRPAEAYAEIEPLLAARDTLVDWPELAGLFASHDGAVADRLLDALAPLPAPVRARALLEAARRTPPSDAARIDGYLGRALPIAMGETLGDVQIFLMERIASRATTPADLASRLDSIARFGDDGTARLRALSLRRSGAALVAEERRTAAGAPAGDLVLFVLGETARDSLHAPRLADWLFARVERDWPASPYLGKALLARIALGGDSTEALQARLAARAESPYLAYLQGRQDPAFARLEDSLRMFIMDRYRAASGVRAPTGDVN